MKYTVKEVTPAYFIDEESGEWYLVSYADPGVELWEESKTESSGMFMAFSGVLRGIKYALIWLEKDRPTKWVDK